MWTTVDDAWISARYASNLAAGHGLVYSVGEVAIEGYTNLAWTVWLAVGIALGVDETAWMTTSGLMLGALTVPFVGELVRRLLPLDAPGHRWPAVLASWIAAADVHLAIVSTNGLETSMYTAALLSAALLATMARGFPVGVALGALAAIRPEGLLAGGLLLGMGSLAPRDLLKRGAGLLAVWGALEAWRYAAYAAWLPNTFAAKADRGLFDHIGRNLSYLGSSAPWWVIVALGLLTGLVLTRQRRPLLLAGIALGGSMAAFRVYMWMPGGRLLVPGALLALVVLAVHGRRPLGRAVLLLWTAVAMVLPFTSTESAARRYDRIHSVDMPNAVSEAVSLIRDQVPVRSWLATRDAGVVAYFWGPENKVAELHNRALTLPHPDGRDTDIRKHTPTNPDVFVVTVADPKSGRFRYGGDRTVYNSVTEPYVYLGRVRQHHRRFYDFYVRRDLGVKPLPKRLVTNRKGPVAPKGRPTPKPPEPPR